MDLENLSDARRIPVQQRGADRVEALLDAVASIIDEEGLDGVSTTAVAYRSGSSVGVLYRYFPNVDSLLRALAQRNLAIYVEVVEKAPEMQDPNHPPPWSFGNDVFVELCRKVPGFARLRFGDPLGGEFLEEGVSNTHVVAQTFADTVARLWGVPADDQLVFHLKMSWTMGLALMTEAFRHDRNGDEAIIAVANEVLPRYLNGKLLGG